MKLNENGDFCLLYVEQADEKQNLFETIGAQTKPVVLMLPMVSGQLRSRLFQRPEDFSDLKHLKRQTGVYVTFLTSGSERLAQMATRSGFPAYPSIDAFADALARGRRAEAEEGEQAGYPVRRSRTGPLVPSAAQLAALKRAGVTSSGPLPRRNLADAFTAQAANEMPWPAPGSVSLPKRSGPLTTPMHERPWQSPANLPDQGNYTDVVSLSHAPTSPLHGPVDLGFWPEPENSTFVEKQPAPSFSTNKRLTPIPPGRYQTPTPTSRDLSLAAEETPQFTQQFSEVPLRRSAQFLKEPYSHHPGWGAEPDPSEPLPEDAAPATATPRAALHPVADLPKMPPPQPPASRGNHPRRGFSPVLIILSLLILGGAGLGSLMVLSRATPAPAAVAPTAQAVGAISFLSSGQLNENTSQGIDDQVQITLHNLEAPVAGKSYYAWLLGDATQTETQSIPLGKLKLVNGTVNFFYTGDSQHTNLLQIVSRFLITAEGSNVTPVSPSPETSNWVYYGAIPATPDPQDAHHFSFLNHLRHLLADEPILDELELPGGLNSWFTRNTQKLIEFTTNSRDQWQDTANMGFVRNEGIRILSYLDGMSFMTPDLPAASATDPVQLDTHLAGLGLVNVRGPSQDPGSYMDQINYHLNGLINAPGSPSNIRSIAATILPIMSNVTTWLQKLRTDDKQLLAMNDAQISQPAAFSLLNDMVVQASNAYSGGTNPSTNQFLQGVVWIHQELQSMASINISSYIQGGKTPTMAPASTSQMPAFLLALLAEWKFVEGLL
jgi:hypothetical protein